MRKTLYKYLSHFFQKLLAPVRCYVCDAPWSYLCNQHARYLLSYPSSCAVCGVPTHNYTYCQQHTHSHTQWVIICFYYTRLISSMIHAIKFGWSYHILTYFADSILLLCKMNPYIQNALYMGKLYITYIPMHYRKEYYIRWYNSPKILATYLGQLLSTQYIPLLSKPHNTRAQKTQKRSRRLQQHTPFLPLSTYIPHDATILVIDDVYTTWTTIHNAMNTIHQHYPTQKIWWICIARNK